MGLQGEESFCMTTCWSSYQLPAAEMLRAASCERWMTKKEKETYRVVVDADWPNAIPPFTVPLKSHIKRGADP